MRSHWYQFGWRDLARVAGPPLIPVAVFALLAHGAALFHAWPPPRPTLDANRTILIHQFEASGAKPGPELLLVGDSSCLMDVSARELGERLGRQVLNIGTLSYLDLNAYALLVRRCAQANPGRLRAVLLLMHPEALRRPSPEAYYVGILQALARGEAAPAGSGIHDRLREVLGLGLLRDRCLARVLPTPLTGALGRRYGFSANLENYLTLHHGSLLEPQSQPFAGNPEYRLAQSLQPASRVFKAAVPPGCKLWVGITPAPEGYVRASYPEQYQPMLAQWGRWLQADATLSELPSTLPAACFAKTTHLNQHGVDVYTTLLASNLARYWP